MTIYERPEANEWIEPILKDYKLSCCDCGLVHNMDFRVQKGNVQFRVRRNNRSTGQMRRHMVAQDAMIKERDK